MACWHFPLVSRMTLAKLTASTSISKRCRLTRIFESASNFCTNTPLAIFFPHHFPNFLPIAQINLNTFACFAAKNIHLSSISSTHRWSGSVPTPDSYYEEFYWQHRTAVWRSAPNTLAHVRRDVVCALNITTTGPYGARRHHSADFVLAQATGTSYCAMTDSRVAKKQKKRRINPQCRQHFSIIRTNVTRNPTLHM